MRFSLNLATSIHLGSRTSELDLDPNFSNRRKKRVMKENDDVLYPRKVKGHDFHNYFRFFLFLYIECCHDYSAMYGFVGSLKKLVQQYKHMDYIYRFSMYIDIQYSSKLSVFSLIQHYLHTHILQKQTYKRT